MEIERQQQSGMWWLLVGAAVVLIGLLCWTIFAGKGYIYADLGVFALPNRSFIHHEMQRGVLPLWQPANFGGFYLHGEGQAGMLHPYHLLVFSLFEPLLQIQIEATLAYVLLLLGCYFLFRRWQVSRSAALLGGLIFAFAGFSRGHLSHVHAMSVLAHTPWMLLAIDHFFRDQVHRGRWCLAISLLNASAILLGYPPFHFFNLIFEAWYVLWFVGDAEWGRRALQWSAAMVGGTLLGAPQWFSTLSSAVGSARTLPSPDFILAGSWHPYNLLSFANPALFLRGFVGDSLPDELDLYPGAAVILLAAYLVFSKSLRDKYPRAVRMLVGFAIFGAVLALGRYAKLFELWLRIPVVGSFRVPARYFFMIQFALAGLCALAFDPFLKFKSRLPVRRSQSAAAIVMIAVSLSTWWLAWQKARAGSVVFKLPLLGELYAASLNDWRGILLGSALVILLCCCWMAALRFDGRWAQVTIAILLVDMVWYTGSMWLAYPTGTMKEVIAELDLPPVTAPARISPPDDGPKVGPHKRYYAIETSNAYTLAGYRVTNGYTSLTPHSELPVESDAYKILMGSQAIWRQSTGSWQTVSSPLPPVRLVSDLVVSQRPALDIARIDYRKQALVAEPHPVDPAAQGTVRLTEVTTQQSRVETDTSGPMLCVLAQRFHAGWHAWSNGRPVALFPVYGDLTGFLAPAGRHITDLRFWPADLTTGLWLAGLGAAISAMTAILVRRVSTVRLAPAGTPQTTAA